MQEADTTMTTDNTLYQMFCSIILRTADIKI